MKTKWFKWLFAVAVVLLVAALALPGCAPEEVAPAEKPAEKPAEEPAEKPAEEPPPVKDTLIIAIPDTPPGIDTDLYSHPATEKTSHQTYTCALEFKMVPCGEPGGPDVLKADFDAGPVPGLFEGYDVSTDGITYTFHLKKGVKSYYGNEFTTKDVKWRMDRAFGLAAVGFFLLLTSDIWEADQIEYIDDYTFSMTANNANPNVLNNIQHRMQYWWDSTEMQKHVTDDDPWATEWIRTHGGDGMGAYMVTEWIAGDRVVMEANPNFVAGKPPIDTLIWKAVPESSNRVALLKDGTIDVAYDLVPTELDALKGTPGVRVINVSSNRQDWVILNYNHPILSNKLVRQALNYAINQEDIVKTAYLGYAQPWRSATSMMWLGALPEEEFPYYYDPGKARELLAEAGYPDGFDIELRYDAGTAVHEVAGTLIQKNLADVGVTVTLKKVPSGVMGVDVISRQVPEMSMWHTSAMTFDINYALNLFYHNLSCCTWGDYNNPEINRRIEEANGVLDPEERIQVHYGIQRDILEDAPLIYISEWNHTVAIRDNVKGWNWWTQGETMMERVYFEGYTGETTIWADEEALAGTIGKQL